IKVTHERYRREFAGDFGALIPAIFTDEPQFSRKGTLFFAREDRDVILPWTDDIEETYKAAYGGESLIGGLPELLWDLPGAKASLIRYHYHDHIAERFASAFADQCGDWCAKNGIMLTGHMMEEPTLESQTHALGEAMRSYRSFQLPGIDMLCDRREFTTAKQAQSAARQYGYPGVLSELYGVTNWDFDFRGHKLQGDWQAALGVTVRVPHLSWVSMNGEAKRDYPATFNYQSPWYQEYPYVEDHFARLASVLTRGKAQTRVGVIHPIESYWLHWGARENTQAIREEMDRNFQNLCGWLLRGLIDFDYICESLLPDLCDPAAIGDAKNSRNRPCFPVGKMDYEVIIVPGLETIRESTLLRLEAFHKAGGRIIFLGYPPEYTGARPDDRGRKLWGQAEHIGFERQRLLTMLEDVRDVGIRDSSGREVQNLLYQFRQERDPQGLPLAWLFIAHADKPDNPHIPQGETLHIRIRGEWAAACYDTISGNITPVAVQHEAGFTLIRRPFFEHDSLLLRLDKGKALFRAETPRLLMEGPPPSGGRLAPDPCPAAVRRYAEPVPVTLHEPNVLLLDIAEYALNESPYGPAEEILRLDNKLRAELGWPLRGNRMAQPWVEYDRSTPHALRLRYAFESEISIAGTELALENAAFTQVSLNGETAAPPDGWYADRCIGKVKLPPVKAGKNILELRMPYGRKTDLEALYLLGDFGVQVRGTRCTLTEPVRTLAFGDITRQGLPFYGGNISYRLEAESHGDGLSLTVSCYYGQLLRVKADGADKGVIAYSPYRLELKGLSGGRHTLEILYYGSRINTFGQLHAVNREPGFWWGPDSWRSSGAAWTYEYFFRPQGIMKSPEISQI
ncbi:MAG: hypothetical protein LBT95_05650, partial [Treponema sp.]|nr:hypothetical protein [Treponema sp.]